MSSFKPITYLWLVTLVLLAGCGAEEALTTDEASTVEQAVPDPVETTSSSEASDPGPEPTESWESIADSYRELQLALTRSDRRYEQALTAGRLDLATFGEILVSERTAVETTLRTLPHEVSEPSVQTPLSMVRSLLEDLALGASEIEPFIDADVPAAQAQLDELLNSVSFDSAEEYEAYLETRPYVEFFDATVHYWDLFGTLEGACFELQTAMLNAGAELLDCTRSDIATDEIDAELTADIDPLVEPTGSIFAPLPAGEHSFTVFEPGLTIDFAEPTGVRSSVDHIDIAATDVEGLTINIVRSDQGLVAGSENPDPSQQDYGPVPTDLDGWLGELPLTVVETGETQIGPDSSRYWDLEVDSDRSSGFPPAVLVLMLFAGDKDDAASGALGILNIPGASVRLIEWNRSDYDDRLFVSWFNDGGLDTAAAEAAVERILSSAR